ncbi:MAG TPA: methyltransferase domain-containing protein [Candidatus Diapherotrites archaeon]|nr:methyltransferase domain-containing protein [Candidatus Diapherotrites archaeon]
MLEIARKRFPELEFRQIPAEELQGKEKFDYLVMADVVEHLSNLEQALAKTAGCCRKGSVLIITSINPVWEPILDLAERLGLKMPEGPHDWPGQERLRQLLERQGFQARSTGYRLLIPKHVPFLSDYANKHFARVPFLRGLGVIQFLVAEFKP